MTAQLITAATTFLGGYAIGCIPIAWLMVRRRHGVDLRRTGTGTGAVGALRVGGVRTAAWSILLEALKGGFVGVVARLLTGQSWLTALAIAGCVAGDAFPITFRRGGRGIVPLVSGLVVALPAAGLLTGMVALVAVAVWKDEGPVLPGVVAVSVPIGLVLGTGSWLSLIAAAVIVAVLLLRIRRHRRAPRLRDPRTPVVIDSAR